VAFAFSLQPFPAGKIPADLQITGQVVRDGTRLEIDYRLTGNIAAILLDRGTKRPKRSHQLWQATCFEFFLGLTDSSRYWEFNLSPTGNWNIYCFDDYRQGMREETSFTRLPFSTELQSDLYHLNLVVDLAPIIPPQQSLDLAITAVVQEKDQEISYWALTHLHAYS
jgi:hypothetical protein